MMAGWRRAVELAMTDDEIERLTALSRSRTEPASRVSRAQMLLAYRENPSFCAVGKELGSPSDASALRGAGAGLWTAGGDRGSTTAWQRTGHHAGGQSLVGVAGVRQAKEHGYPHELWTTRLLARHAREHGPTVGTNVLPSWFRHRVQDPRQEEIKPHKVRYYLERRNAEFEQKMAEVLCVYREVQVLKKAAASRAKPSNEWRSSPTTKNRESRPSQRRHPICRPSPASMQPSRGITSTNVMAR